MSPTVSQASTERGNELESDEMVVVFEEEDE